MENFGAEYLEEIEEAVLGKLGGQGPWLCTRGADGVPPKCYYTGGGSFPGI